MKIEVKTRKELLEMYPSRRKEGRCFATRKLDELVDGAIEVKAGRKLPAEAYCESIGEPTELTAKREGRAG
jgi:hypothetical protein